ncbi:hypothetical protein [Nocardioides allogilvus]|uniref:hypothetical protein n=1 Tax=Nocardioides allogilvus TaxID=2072017 RepID=UPI000D313AC0|nr:hypothetical protein [Nocardioides allogilvus]
MKPRPRINPLVGLLVAVLVAALAATCSGRDSADEPSEAETFKAEMDTEAARLLPDLMDAVGGRLGGMQATYYERGGFGIWDYTASGGIVDTAASTTDSLAASAAVLAHHGYAVETDDEQRRVRGDKGEIVVLVGASLLKGEATGLNISMGNLGTVSEGDDYAENAPPADYLAFVDPQHASR